MDITETFKVAGRQAWREWLENNHESKREIWLLSDDRSDVETISYLDSVEEAICFGWIDGIQKRRNEFEKAQRFSPRKPKGNWTELNKARARRLIRLSLMTESGFKTLPNLTSEYSVPKYVFDALKREPEAMKNFNTLPPLYVRVRVGYVDEMRKKPLELEKRLSNFVRRTAQGKLFGNWNDGGRLDDDG